MQNNGLACQIPLFLQVMAGHDKEIWAKHVIDMFCWCIREKRNKTNKHG
ncbi:hypothetical protein F383_20399 [Gossypium arboreum]|uniref:Uncharacterized protein n=1 Tax=Gossypium arboreum TaxID=29729 RepID=A0A0B0NID7_GOSAR|nr:hypothetical protein F383_20399 [Gossypium arboreum]